MAPKGSKSNKKLLYVAALPVLYVAWGWVSPYLEETKQMGLELEKLDKAVQQIKADGEAFSGDWQKNLMQREKEALSLVPDVISTSDVLRYFSTDFARKNQGIQFSTLLPQSVGISNIKVDEEDPNIRVRVSRLQIKAITNPEVLLAYVEHLEKYPGSFRLSELAMNSVGTTKADAKVDLSILVEMFLSPKEWLPKDLKDGSSIDPKRDVAAIEGSQKNYDWFQVSSLEVAKEPTAEVAQPEAEEVEIKVTKPLIRRIEKPVPHSPPNFKIARFIGDSIVVDERLYEVGDQVNGWSLVSIVGSTRSLRVQKDKTIYRIEIK